MKSNHDKDAKLLEIIKTDDSNILLAVSGDFNSLVFVVGKYTMLEMFKIINVVVNNFLSRKGNSKQSNFIHD